MADDADRIYGATQMNGDMGESVAGAGDTNGDGLMDWLVGEPGSGSVHVFLGPGGAVADATISSLDGVGVQVASAGDTNGDGLDDVLHSNGKVNWGNSSTWLVHGPIPAASLATDADATFLGVPGDGTGESLAGGADVDGDGLDDILIGGSGNDERATEGGVAYLVTGDPSGLNALGASTAQIFGNIDELELGAAVAILDDSNGDGVADLLIGGPHYQQGIHTGASYYFPGPVSGALSIASATGVFLGPTGGSQAGASVASARDRNGDGTSELLIGAPGHDCLFVVMGGPGF